MTVVIDRTRPKEEHKDPLSVAEKYRAKKEGGKGALYKARVPIYPKRVTGLWRRC